MLAEILRRAKENPEALHAAPVTTVIGRPDETAAARRRIAVMARRRYRPDPLVGKPSRTRDGTSFTILGSANSSDPSEMQAAMKNGANGGIGLVRTESMILNNYDEDRQVMEYRRMLENGDGYPVVVRLFDPGADDGAPWVQTVKTVAAREQLYDTQLRALLRGVGVALVEHLIFGEQDFVSLAECGFFTEY